MTPTEGRRGSRRAHLGAFGSIVSFAVVLGALVWMDPRVADRLAHVMREPPDHWVDRARATAEILLTAARDQSIEHAPLVIFTLAAAVLVLFMTRT